MEALAIRGNVTMISSEPSQSFTGSRLRIEGGALRVDLWGQTETQEAEVELSEHGPEDMDHETHETHEPEVEESEHGREDVEQETQEPERGGRGAVELA